MWQRIRRPAGLTIIVRIVGIGSSLIYLRDSTRTKTHFPVAAHGLGSITRVYIKRTIELIFDLKRSFIHTYDIESNYVFVFFDFVYVQTHYDDSG